MTDGLKYWGAQLPDPNETVKLWPGAAPGENRRELKFEVAERSTSREFMDRAVTGISDPLFTVFRPKNPDGSAVLIFTGGNFVRVVVDKEGFESARRLNEAGVTAFVMRYRLPHEGWPLDAPLADAQRAMRLIRSRADTFNIDPARLGVMGFSAGGHVAALLATRHAQTIYSPADDAAAASARPAFQALFYPVITMLPPDAFEGAAEAFLGKDAPEPLRARYSCERNVDAQTPPAFLATALDDATIPPANTKRYYDALCAAGIPSELHLFETGGHGFGIRLAQDAPVSIWPELFLAWGRARGIFRG